MKVKKIGIILCLVLFVYFIGGIIYNFGIDDKTPNQNVNKEIGLQIKGYNYLCKNSKPKLYKQEFRVLKEILESEEVNYQEYANSVAKLFLIDLYTLSNKKNMYDVGGVEFVYSNAQENFKLNVENTLYKYMEDIDDGKRRQSLPTVSNITIINNEMIDYEINGEQFEAYKINLEIEYTKDLGYDKSAELILIHSDKNVYVVEKN